MKTDSKEEYARQVAEITNAVVDQVNSPAYSKKWDLTIEDLIFSMESDLYMTELLLKAFICAVPNEEDRLTYLRQATEI